MLSTVAGFSRFLIAISISTLLILWTFAFCLAGAAVAAEPISGTGAPTAGEPLGDELFGEVPAQGRVTRRFEIYNPHSREHLQAIKEMGFTQVILDWPNLHSDAAELGLDVVLANWWTIATETKEIERAIEYTTEVDPRRLVGVSMMDEPERNSPETNFSFYRSLYRDLRKYLDERLPHVKLEMSHWGPLSRWTSQEYESFVPLYQGADRMRLMPYPDLDEGPLAEVYLQMARSRRLMRLAGRNLPLVVILQTWVLPENPKLPTIDELRVMAYSAILGGAETVSFFSYDPPLWQQTAGFSAGFAELMRELTAFSQRYGGEPVESQIDSAGVLRGTVRPPGGQPVEVVVNTNRTAVGQLAPLAVVISGGTPAVAESPPAQRSTAGRRCALRQGLLARWRSRVPRRQATRQEQAWRVW